MIFLIFITDRGNMTKVADNFYKTIEILVDNGADPGIDNHSGSNVNILLTEFNISELSLLIVNKLSAKNFGNTNATKHPIDSYILIKDKNGQVSFTEMKEKKEKDLKPVILENIRIDTKFVNKKVDKKPEDSKCFMNTFKNFIQDKSIKNTKDDKSNIVITKSESLASTSNLPRPKLVPVTSTVAQVKKIQVKSRSECVGQVRKTIKRVVATDTVEQKTKMPKL